MVSQNLFGCHFMESVTCHLQTPADSDQTPAVAEGAAAFEQILATQELDSRSDSPLPIAVDNGKPFCLCQTLECATCHTAS